MLPRSGAVRPARPPRSRAGGASRRAPAARRRRGTGSRRRRRPPARRCGRRRSRRTTGNSSTRAPWAAPTSRLSSRLPVSTTTISSTWGRAAPSRESRNWPPSRTIMARPSSGGVGVGRGVAVVHEVPLSSLLPANALRLRKCGFAGARVRPGAIPGTFAGRVPLPACFHLSAQDGPGDSVRQAGARHPGRRDVSREPSEGDRNMRHRLALAATAAFLLAAGQAAAIVESKTGTEYPDTVSHPDRGRGPGPGRHRHGAAREDHAQGRCLHHRLVRRRRRGPRRRPRRRHLEARRSQAPAHGPAAQLLAREADRRLPRGDREELPRPRRRSART